MKTGIATVEKFGSLTWSVERDVILPKWRTDKEMPTKSIFLTTEKP